MNRFGTFNIVNDTTSPSPVINMARTTSYQPRRSVMIKLDFDNDNNENGSTISMPEKMASKLFLKKERKNLSDSTPSRKVSESHEIKEKTSDIDTKRKKHDSCQEKTARSPSIEGALPRLGSSTSIKVGNDSPSTQEVEENGKASSRRSDERSPHSQPWSRSEALEQSRGQSFAKFCEKAKINQESKQVIDTEILDFKLPCPNKLSVNKNLRDPDLAMISAQTVANLFCQTENQEFLIIDCRFDYEYKEGHIKGAINILSQEILEKIFFTHRDLLYNPRYIQDLKKDCLSTLAQVESYNNTEASSLNDELPILIFHCEFSQKRGPRAFRALRSKDRDLNINNWPNLFYIETYVLDGGYSDFYSQFPEHCDGSYTRMVDKKFKSEYSLAKESDQRHWSKKTLIEFD